MAPRLLESVNVPPPRLSVDGVWGCRTGEHVGGRWSRAVLEGGGLGVQNGGERAQWHVLWISMSWRVRYRGDLMEPCGRMTWKECIAIVSIGSQSRASPAWQVWHLWIC